MSRGVFLKQLLSNNVVIASRQILNMLKNQFRKSLRDVKDKFCLSICILKIYNLNAMIIQVLNKAITFPERTNEDCNNAFHPAIASCSVYV